MGEQRDLEELRFMASYVWRTLIYLYDRLRLREKIQLRNLDGYIEFGPEVVDVFKVFLYFGELVEAVREVLRRMQFTMYEEVVPERYSSGGRVEARLLGRFLPSYTPIRRRRVEYVTPANLLLVYTVIETREMARRALRGLSAGGGNPLYEAFRFHVAGHLQDIISMCDVLLSDPLLRPVYREALRRRASLEELEREVELEYRRRPKIYRPYRKLLRYTRLLRAKMGLAARTLEKLGGKLLEMSVTSDKIYELYGFTVILETLVEFLGDTGITPVSVEVDRQGRELILKGRGLSLSVAYNAIPDDLKSKFEKAIAYGLLDDRVDTQGIRGLPDTFILAESSRGRRLLVVDYKYSRNLSYQVSSRFKVYAYLNEYNADVAVVVSPTPCADHAQALDEEGRDQAGFYREVARHQGALIYIDGRGKALGILYLEPDEEKLERSKEALKVILKVYLDGLYP